MRRVLLVVVLTLGLTGCARRADQSPQGTPTAPLSATPSPDPAPTPSTPIGVPAPQPSGLTTTIASDEFPAGVVVGTVTADSDGPCYLIETDDGKQYALVGRGGTVHRGQRVRAQTEQRPSATDCGPGIQLALVKLETS